MILYIKNMVCHRCKMVVEWELEKHAIFPIKVELGQVELNETLTEYKISMLETDLKRLGFELIDNKKARIVEKIKNIIIELIYLSNENNKYTISEYLTQKLPYDYTYLSNLFSEIESNTIEKYFITQRIERVKELLTYNEISLAEISVLLGYSSVAYLSNQFKKITGLTPTNYKLSKENKRTSIDNL